MKPSPFLSYTEKDGTWGDSLRIRLHLNELFNKAVPKEEPEDLWYPSLFKPDDF